jgi:8-hydroxy-5-deazaflavin:NADPH oxidoreductase
MPKRARAQTGGRPGTKETIAMLGTGRLGQALGKRWAAAGHTLVYGSRTPEDERVRTLVKESGPRASATSLKEAAARADIVVFALPWKPVKDVLAALGDLTGKLIIDPMNAYPKIVEGYPYSPDNPISVGEQLQAWVPQATVVKAFNTISFRNVADPARAGGPVTIPLAGADVAAKGRVASLVSELGLEPLDTGPLIAARYLEDMLRLSVGYFIYTKGKAFEFYLRRTPG